MELREPDVHKEAGQTPQSAGVFSLTNKVRAGFVFPLLILAAVSSISYWNAVQVPEISRLVEHTLKVQHTVKDSTASLSQLLYAQRSYVLTGQRKYLELFRASAAALNQQLKALTSLNADNPSQQRRLAELQDLISQRIVVAELGIEARDKSGFDAALESVRTSQGYQLSERIRTIFGEMESEAARQLDQRQQRAQASAKAAISVSGYGAMVAFLFVSVASMLIARNITAPVGRLVDAAGRIGSGMLDHRVPVEGGDELGVLAKAFNNMAARLQETQDELLHQTSILRSVLSSIGEGVAVADTAGRFLVFNPAAERILRCGPIDSGPDRWTEHYGLFLPDKKTPYPPEDLPLARAIRGESVDDAEIFVRHGEGSQDSWLTVAGRPLRGEDGVLRGGVAVFHDTTDRRRAQQALASERNLLRTLIDVLPQCIFVKDAERRYVLVNEAQMRIQGCASTEAVVGRYDCDFFPREVAERFRQGDSFVLTSGTGLVGEEELLADHAGRPAWMSATRVPLRDAAGSIIGLVGICHDITNRKQIEEKIGKLNDDLRQRALELESANRELEAFCYSVAHDLRAPLRHMNGYAELLAESAGPALDQEGRRYIQKISGSAKEMGRLIDDLLVFSGMGRSELRATRVPLDELAREVVGNLDHEKQASKVAWKIAELPSVQGDPAMLRLVFVNLFSNALKYTQQRAEAEIEVGTCNGHSGEVVIFVRDNGVGFDMKYVGKLFGVFQRLHSSREFEGTGIGLANVRRIIHRHGGKTWAEGAVGSGATFYFSLPSSAGAVQKDEGVPAIRQQQPTAWEMPGKLAEELN